MATRGYRGASKGRRAKLTDETQEQICTLIRSGNYVKTACMAVGISQTTYYNWLALGEEARQAGRSTKYVQFLESIEEAEALGEANLVAGIAQQGGWKGKLAILRRRYRDRWSDRVEMTGAGGAPLQAGGIVLNVVHNAPSDDSPWEVDPDADEVHPGGDEAAVDGGDAQAGEQEDA